MPEQLNSINEIPTYIQALLNIIAFLITAVAVWYGYFVRGRDKANSNLSDYTKSFDLKVFRKLGEDVNRIANSLEQIYTTMKHDSDEAEIARRVEEHLIRQQRGRKKLKDDDVT